MKKALTLLLLVLQISFSLAQESLDYFLPADVNYNPEIPTPEQFFKQELGEWHLTHAQLVSYVQEIARLSDRAIIYEYARSHENKPLLHLVFTSPENQQNLEDLKALHTAYSDPESDIPLEGVPLVVSLTYGVHGNESSGSNSSVLTAYHLAAAEGEAIERLLASNIVIVDPCLNPDGFTRHSTWANMHQGFIAVGDKNSRQFQEVWPRGRTNHYWFDLNRDYLLLVNPESRGRVARFHEWKPNIVTDHHEASSDFSFFFQPGVPSRNNPLTPEKNYLLTREIAAYHASYLDEIGSAYFSEEIFDDYYFGKGSSYPDIHGGIGILFEQSSIRGRIRETSNGVKSLALAMKNQFTVSLSTLEAAVNLREELLVYQKEFYREALSLGVSSEVKAYVFGSSNDRVKTRKFVDFLSRHQIEVFRNKKDVDSFVVPVQQKQYRLLTSIFEEVVSFSDTTFYDVSTWTVPHAYDVPVSRVQSLKGLQFSEQPVRTEKVKGRIFGGESRIGYLFRWHEYSSPKALYKLQDAGLITKVAGSATAFEIEGRNETFAPGSILIPVSSQQMDQEAIHVLVARLAMETGIDFYGLSTGLSPSGIDVGSSSFSRLYKPEVLLITGGSSSSYSAGETWHLFDQNYQIPLTLGPSERLGSMDLNRYNCIILPSGSYREWDDKEVGKLKAWTEAGGILIACGSAGSWAAKQELGQTTYIETLKPDSTRYLNYSERREESDMHGIRGVILKAKLDLSHPLCFGYVKEDLALFKRGTTVAAPLGVKYTEPVKFDTEPYLSGWISQENLDRLKEAPVVSVQSLGRGKLITYHESMNFRGYWLGTHKLFANSVFFGQVID
jgi:hypothetical protein